MSDRKGKCYNYALRKTCFLSTKVHKAILAHPQNKTGNNGHENFVGSVAETKLVQFIIIVLSR